jgi:iron complex transport system substrate-binding protein
MKRLYILFVFLVTQFLFSCQSPSEKVETMELTDDLGRKIIIKKNPTRFVSLVPSMTEMLASFCDSSTLVAVTDNCDFPEWVKTKPQINTYPLDVEAVLKAKPDLVFVVTEMCAFEDIKKLEDLGIPVYIQRYNGVEGIFIGIEDLGKIMGKAEKAKYVADSLRNIKSEIEKLPKTNLKVLNITWIDPIIVYGYNSIFIDKIQLAGAENAMDEVLDKAYPTVTREYILKMNPDVIFGGTFDRMDSTFFTIYPELKKTNAYINKRCYKLTDNLNARPTPRVLESVMEMRNYLVPVN